MTATLPFDNLGSLGWGCWLSVLISPPLEFSRQPHSG